MIRRFKLWVTIFTPSPWPACSVKRSRDGFTTSASRTARWPANRGKARGLRLRQQLNAICRAALRHVIQGTRSEKGLENHSVIRSLFDTAKLQGKKVHDFFLNLFTKSTAQAQSSLYRNPFIASPSPQKSVHSFNTS